MFKPLQKGKEGKEMTKDELIALLYDIPGDFEVRLEHPEFMNEELSFTGIQVVKQKRKKVLLEYENVDNEA